MAAKKKSTKAAPKAKRQNKTAFVLGLPADLSAKDAVAKAKENGMKISEGYVYKIRSSAKTGGGSAKSAAPKARKTSARKASGAPSKTDFVRALPAGMSYAEAAEKAKAVGIDLSKAYFYVLRSELKKKGGRSSAAPATRGKPGPKPKASSGSSKRLRLTSDDPGEQVVIEAIRTMGVGRARALIAIVEKFERG